MTGDRKAISLLGLFPENTDPGPSLQMDLPHKAPGWLEDRVVLGSRAAAGSQRAVPSCPDAMPIAALTLGVLLPRAAEGVPVTLAVMAGGSPLCGDRQGWAGQRLLAEHTLHRDRPRWATHP